MPSFPALSVAKLDDEAALFFTHWAIISLSLIILPMYTATILLFWGVMGIVIVYAALVSCIALTLRGTRGFFWVLEQLMGALDPTTNLVTRIFVGSLAVVFGVLGLVFGLVLSIADRLTRIIEFATASVVEFFALFLSVPLGIIRGLWGVITSLVAGMWGILANILNRIAKWPLPARIGLMALALSLLGGGGYLLLR